jgi:hypothetical protein
VSSERLVRPVTADAQRQQAAYLRRRLRELDSEAATLATQYKLWSELLPREAYPDGKLTDAVITALETVRVTRL